MGVLVYTVSPLGAFPCSAFLQPKCISVVKSAKLLKRATEKRDRKASFTFGRDLRPKGKCQGYRKEA